MTPHAISRYEIKDDKVLVFTPYSEQVASACRSWGGKYKDGAWHLSLSRLEAVQAKIGTHQNDLVQVDVSFETYDEYGAQLMLEWHILAGRRGREQRADLHAELVAGTIPPVGGSVKYPRVRASEDSIFRLWVPRDFATTFGLNVTLDPKANLADDARKAEFVDLMTKAAVVATALGWDAVVDLLTELAKTEG